MRVNRFTFKKTKRVKQVVVHPGLSVDLTVPEAEALLDLLMESTEPAFPEDPEHDDPVWNAIGELVGKLHDFVEENK